MSDLCGSCLAHVHWVEMAKSGKMMPIDLLPAENGNVIIKDGKGFVLNKAAREIYVGSRFMSHFVTCPNAKEHRK